MNPKLTKSPLTYVLGQIKIGPILAIEKQIENIQESLRNEFPHYSAIQTHEILMKDDNQPLLRRFTQWNFYDVATTTGILLQKDAITIHTTDYESFQRIKDIFGRVLSQINQILNIGSYTRLGLRYINLIQDSISNSIANELLGFQLKSNNIFKTGFFSKTETIQDTNIGMIKIQAIHTQAQRFDQQVDNLFVPPDLLPVANLLSFKKYNKPTAGFLILDLDHFTLNLSERFDETKILSGLEILHDGVYKSFEEAINKDALDSWR